MMLRKLRRNGRKDDIAAWHFLGLTLAKLGKADDARKAHEKAVRLVDSLLEMLKALARQTQGP